MGYDYDALYRDTRHALGAPTDDFVEIFETLGQKPLTVLDIGCGQGRDALFLARLGHQVIGVDLSPAGIRDMLTDAEAEALSISGHACDVRDYTPDGPADLLLIDRTLHMLNRDDRLAVLVRLLDAVKGGGWLLLADEPSNIPEFKACLGGHDPGWTLHLDRRGVLFAQRKT